MPILVPTRNGKLRITRADDIDGRAAKGYSLCAGSAFAFIGGTIVMTPATGTLGVETRRIMI